MCNLQLNTSSENSHNNYCESKNLLPIDESSVDKILHGTFNTSFNSNTVIKIQNDFCLFLSSLLEVKNSKLLWLWISLQFHTFMHLTSQKKPDQIAQSWEELRLFYLQSQSLQDWKNFWLRVTKIPNTFSDLTLLKWSNSLIYVPNLLSQSLTFRKLQYDKLQNDNLFFIS